jgi:hypothetical protein
VLGNIQMKSLQIHTTEQPASDITTFVLSCDRLHLLERTLKSFTLTQDLVTKMVILDDSGTPGVFEELVEKYGSYCDVICFPENRGQWWALDFMVSYCYTKYIFYLEDDWEFTRTGYLSKSKQVLSKYRDIGLVDISFRTFEWQGIDSYDRNLIDDMFYYKKPWRITKNHLPWTGWCGSPNLKRRDDLITLGRVEKYYNEINIDRKFHALGFKSVFLKDAYLYHLGDTESRMVNKRPLEGVTPEHFLPAEVKKNRTYPFYNYHQTDVDFNKNFIDNLVPDEDITIVTALVDINRENKDGREFESYYLAGLSKFMGITHPLVIYADSRHHNKIKEARGKLPLTLIDFNKESILNNPYYPRIAEIVNSPGWKDQSEWMSNSVVSIPEYLTLTHMKTKMLKDVAHNSKYCYWIDAGICNSYNISKTLDHFDFNVLNKEDLFMMQYPYNNYTEIHGYNIAGYRKLCNSLPDMVTRACFFGGPNNKLLDFIDKFEYYVKQSLELGYIGTEESIFTIITKNHPDIVNPFKLISGDVNVCLNYYF